MDFKLSEQQIELQEVARNFAQNEMVDVALSIEETGEPLSKEWLKKNSSPVTCISDISPESQITKFASTCALESSM